MVQVGLHLLQLYHTPRFYLAAAGTQTAGLAFGYAGSPPYTGATEKWNGTSWSPGGTMGTARYGLGGCGTQTAALGFGGYLSPGNTAATESYDGSSWTSVNSINTARSKFYRSRITNSSISFWRIYNSIYKQQQNLGMVLLGQVLIV
jgi:hypothetical protein